MTNKTTMYTPQWCAPERVEWQRKCIHKLTLKCPLFYDKTELIPSTMVKNICLIHTVQSIHLFFFPLFTVPYINLSSSDVWISRHSGLMVRISKFNYDNNNLYAVFSHLIKGLGEISTTKILWLNLSVLQLSLSFPHRQWDVSSVCVPWDGLSESTQHCTLGIQTDAPAICALPYDDAGYSCHKRSFHRNNKLCALLETSLENQLLCSPHHLPLPPEMKKCISINTM